jgi:hypothetical protein
VESSNSSPKTKIIIPAIISTPCSIVYSKFVCLSAIDSKRAFPDKEIMTTVEMVRVIPIEIAIPKKIPKPIKFIDNANSITITTPRHGVMPMASAEITGLIY